MQKDLSEILDYFDLLKKAPKAKKIIKELGDLRAARKDEVRMRDASVPERIIAAAPEEKDGYIKVKAIL
jgi:Asp-tRNA(Asn)/Glu-tRNA(Gln) amidotransferase C subunit